MIENDQGLIKTYNHFHYPRKHAPEIVRLRTLYATMDRAVFDAYGCATIAIDCEFLLDYAIDEEGSGRRKKSWRYRWPDATRDEVLARLLELIMDDGRIVWIQCRVRIEGGDADPGYGD